MKFKKFWKVYLIWLVSCLVVGAGIFCAFYFGGGKGKVAALNGTSFTGIILVCLAGLMWVAREGFFDFLSYGFKQMGAMIFTKDPNSLKDFPGYKEDKRNVRKFASKYFVIVAFVGLLFVIAFIILRIIWKDLY